LFVKQFTVQQYPGVFGFGAHTQCNPSTEKPSMLNAKLKYFKLYHEMEATESLCFSEGEKCAVTWKAWK